MSLASGSRLGAYEIVSALGAGGMGEVYKARDTRLDRIVAIKVMPSDMAADPQFRARFDREARAISQLQHPHICTLYDVGEADGTAFLVMELLQGQTLADRLKKGALPLDEALKIAIDVADALSAAHRQGIVHRDLKPANIMLTKTGAKLLDFGLARAAAPVMSIGANSTQQTGTTHLTGSGTILGTLHYMSPEQLEGKEADARSDIWELGVVTYEMVTGTRPFDGDSGASVVGAILKDTPSVISAKEALSPPALDHLVARCLEKDPDDRWQTAGDVKRELQWISRNPLSGQHEPVRTRWWRTIAGGVSILGLIGTATIASTVWRHVDVAQPLLKFDVTAPPHALFASPQATLPTPLLALSPDGKWLAFVAQGLAADAMLWLRAIDGTSTVPLIGTEEATYPFWSPDSHAVAFFAQDKLKRVDIRAGTMQVICDAVDSRGGAWGGDNTIVFAVGSGPLLRVPATGGQPTPFTTVSSPARAHRWPSFLPDGKHLLFLARAPHNPESTISVADIDGSNQKVLFPSQFSVHYVDGFVLTLANGILSAQPFDPQKLTLTGDAIPIAQGVAGSTVNYGSFSASNTGLLAYAGDANAEMQLAWFDRTGRRTATLGPVRDYADVQLMPGGRRALVTRTDIKAGSSNIWSMDVNSGDATPLTFDDATNAQPVVSPDGQEMVFRSSKELPSPIFHRLTSGVGDADILLHPSTLGPKDSGNLFPSDWSHDGRFVLFHAPTAERSYDIFVLPMFGDRKARPFARTRGSDVHARFSPDGKWVAYSSAESGRHQIYVQPFPDANGRWQISTDGGSEPRWRGDGREIFFLGADRRMMVVQVVSTQPTFQAAPATPLFATRIADFANPYRTTYDVTPDGQHFLINEPAEGAAQPSISVVVNWHTLLKR
jgi:serine/threonine protein kinase/Tol biopolymer transport system component